MKSVFFRSFLSIALTLLLCFILLGTAISGIGRGYVISRRQENMRKNAQEISRTASAIAAEQELNSWSMGIILSSIESVTGNDILITDASGRVLACSEASILCRHIGMTVPDEVFLTVRESKELAQTNVLSEFYEGSRFLTGGAIRKGSSTDLVGYTIVSSQIGHMLGEWNDIGRVSLTIGMAVFVIALLSALVYSRQFARPLDEIAAAAANFARGDFSVRVKQVSDPSNEIGALIESFNTMADSLEKADAQRSEFIANISHELRTPMTTISGFADGILDGTIPESEERKYLTAIRDETRRLSRLVRDMLDASQMAHRAQDQRRRSSFDLTELALQVLLSFEARATKKELDVDPQLPDNSIMVFADRDAITQVIYNLLDNAVKFADVRSCITLRVYKDDRKAYVSVKNVGNTIPPEELPFIFDRFHKSDKSRSMDKDGVGLGLYLVKAIITGHEEDIAVQSADGVTEFVFTLSLAKAASTDRRELK